MAASKIYRPDTCAYCNEHTWCEQRPNGNMQCRACKAERFFDHVALAPMGQKLIGWQRKAIRAIYGTMDKAGRRRYRKAYISTPKQNGKSYMLGGIPLYHLTPGMETENNPEVYGIASAKDQAGIVYKAALGLLNANPQLRAVLKSRPSTKRLLRNDNSGLYEVLAADGDVNDGKRGNVLLVDELHRFKTRKAEEVITVLKKGQISRMPVINGVLTGEPLLIYITTSGDEQESPIWASEYEYACGVRDGVIDDPSYYVQIHQADPDKIQSDKKYWMSREARVLANPSHEDNGGFLADSVIEAEMSEAMRRPEKQSDYIRLNLNVPSSDSETPAVVMQDWYACGGTFDLRSAGTEYKPEALIEAWKLDKQRCFLGVDLAWVTDMTGMSLVFPPCEAFDKWRLLFFTWLPEGRVEFVEKQTQHPLRKWVQQGFIETVPGVRMNVLAIEERIRWARERFVLEEVCYDPYGQLPRSMEVLEREGIRTTLIDQQIKPLNHPTKAFLSMLMAGEFEHANNPVANWHVSCVALQSDSNDLVRPIKPKRESAKKRIDLVNATINALASAVGPAKKDVLEDDLVLL